MQISCCIIITPHDVISMGVINILLKITHLVIIYNKYNYYPSNIIIMVLACNLSIISLGHPCGHSSRIAHNHCYLCYYFYQELTVPSKTVLKFLVQSNLVNFFFLYLFKRNFQRTIID